MWINAEDRAPKERFWWQKKRFDMAEKLKWPMGPSFNNVWQLNTSRRKA